MKDFFGLGKLWPFIRQDKLLFWVTIFLIPVLMFLQSALPFVLKSAIDHGLLMHDEHYLLQCAIVFFALVIFEYIARGAQSMVSAMVVHRMISRLRRHLVKHVLWLPSRFHDQTLSGALVTRATSDFDNLSESLNQGILSSVVDLAVLFGYLVGMFILDWRLACVTLVILPVVSWLVFWFTQQIKDAMVVARRKIATLNGFGQECLYGVSTIKLLVAQKDVAQKFNVLGCDYRDAQMRSVWLDALMFATLDGIASITIGIILWSIVTQTTLQATLSAGLLVAFVQYVQQVFEPLKQLGNKMAMLQGAYTAIDRIFGLLEKPDKIAGELPLQSLTSLNKVLEFNHVNFSYDLPEKSTTKQILRDITFTVKKGESLAIIGPTGSGKSTIVKLLLKLYDGYAGSISLFQQELNTLSPLAVRQHISYVPQDFQLFEGTLEFNITLGRSGISPAAIAAVSNHIGLNHVISRLPDGLQFSIREGGANLSHGERQLVVFARALVTSPELIILDEATSAIDPASEKLIQDATKTLLKNHTVIVIAHRLSTVESCDQMLVMEHGTIKERGSHSELLRLGSLYSELIKNSASH